MNIYKVLLLNCMRSMMLSFSRRIFICFSQVPRVTTLIHPCSKSCDFSGPLK